MGDSDNNILGPVIILEPEFEEKNDCVCCGPNANLNLLCINPFLDIDDPPPATIEITIETETNEKGESF